MVRIKEESVRHGKGGNSGGNSDEESMGIGDENDGTLIGNSILSTNGCEGSPLLQVEGRVGVGNEAVSLGVGRGAHDDPSEHGVTAVPDLRLNGWSPTPLGEIGVFLAPFLYGIVEDGAGNAGAGSDVMEVNKGQFMDGGNDASHAIIL